MWFWEEDRWEQERESLKGELHCMSLRMGPPTQWVDMRDSVGAEILQLRMLNRGSSVGCQMS